MKHKLGWLNIGVLTCPLMVSTHNRSKLNVRLYGWLKVRYTPFFFFFFLWEVFEKFGRNSFCFRCTLKPYVYIFVLVNRAVFTDLYF